MKIYSWNVNGIRAVVNKGTFQAFIAEHQPDIVCLQETKIDDAQLSLWREGTPARQSRALSSQGVAVAAPRNEKSGVSADVKSQPESLGVVNLTAEQGQAVFDLEGYEEFWNSSTRKKGYSGTAIFSKIKPLSIDTNFPLKIAKQFGLSDDGYGDANAEGRVLTAEFDSFYLVTVYTPNSKGDLSRLGLRHKNWDPAFLTYIKILEQHKPVIFCGDLNVAYNEEDLANPKANIGKHGFTDEERSGFQRFLDAGFVDTFRMFTPKGNGHYTWWTHWANARSRNVGWRIDYFLVSESLKTKVLDAEIHADVMGSDHCPVSIELQA